MRRRRIIPIAAVATFVAVGAFVVVRRSDPDTVARAGVDADAAKTAKADARDITRSEDFGGTVGHGEPTTVRLSGGGTVTGLPTTGDEVQFGQRLAEVDGAPVVLLPGARPMWRSLGQGVSAGQDVRQLEAALVVLGYADPAKVGVDETWTAATTTAVKSLQHLLGMSPDGRLDIGEVVFSEHVVRVGAVHGELGDAASSTTLDVTELEQSVTVALKASQLELSPVGTAVSIELPSGDDVDGTVTAIGAAIIADDGSVTFPVTISTPPIDAVDGVPVTVTVTTVDVENATAVPAEALLSLAEGGYGIEVPDAAAASGRRLIGVEVGEFADGWVQVTGDVHPGDQVVEP